MPKYRVDLLALLFLALVVLVFFSPVFLFGGWIPYGGGDLVSFLWPSYTFAARAFPGDLPLWNPHQYGGAPFWADNQSGVLYPPLLLSFLLSDAPSYNWLQFLVMAHIWLAGAAMYLCLRYLRRGDTALSLPAAVLGAVAWMLSDVFVTHQGNLNLIAVAAWLPLVFLGAWRGLQAASGAPQSAEAKTPWRWAILAGAAFGIGTLAGHAQMTYFTGLTVGAAGLWHFGAAVSKRRRGASHASPLQVIVILVVIGMTTFGLSAASLLPALEMTGYTARAGLSYEEAARYSIPPEALVGLVAPGVHGRGPANFSGDWDRVEVGYMGVVALGLALWGALRGLRGRDGLAIFLALLGGAAFLLALGEFLPLHRLAYELLPGFKSIRVPARLVLLFSFAGAVLAAFAADSFWPVRQRWTQASLRGQFLLVALVTAELIIFGAGIEVQYDDPRSGYQHPDVIAWLREQPGAPFRVEGAAPRWQPDSAALHGGALFDIYGISNPLALAAYDAWYWGVGQRGTPLYNFLGAKYVIAGGEPPGDSSFVPVLDADSGVTVYLNTNALPLAHLVYDAVPVDSPEAAWAAVHAPSWDPRAVVYVEGGPPLAVEPPPGAGLFYTRYDANTISLVVNTPEPAYLLLSEVYYPGWAASIDGEPAPIYRANTAFRAVYIDAPGEHTVVLAFRPPLVIVGLAVTLLTVIALGGVGLWWWRGRPA